MSDDQKEIENEKRRERRLEILENINDVEREFLKINLKHKKRSLRQQRTGKQKLEQNLKAKRGMRLFREEGRLKDYEQRTKSNRNEEQDWTSFIRKGKNYSEKLDECKPDVVAKINEEFRKQEDRMREKEAERKKQIDEDGGEWVYNAEFDDYHWVGEGDRKLHHDPVYEPLTSEELKDIRCQEEEFRLAEIEQEKKLAKERRKIKQDEIKAAMGTPIAPLPQKEKCEYEKLRDRNINERMKAMEKAGFFNDLNDYKKKIGLA